MDLMAGRWTWTWTPVRQPGGESSSLRVNYWPILARADWFQAGKGQDPNITRLDGDMDDYWNQKAAAEEQGGEMAESTA